MRVDARPDPRLRRRPTARRARARSRRLHPLNRTARRLWRPMPEDAVRDEPPLSRDGALQRRSRTRHPRACPAHRATRRHRSRQPPPSCFASHLPRPCRWRTQRVLRGEVLPRRQAGEVGRDVFVARRWGLRAFARTSLSNLGNQKHPTSQASPARSRPYAPRPAAPHQIPETPQCRH